MTADNDIVERLREGARDASGRDMADHASTWGSLTCADLREAAAEIVRLRGEVAAMEACAVKYLGWLGVKDVAAGLRKDMADPDMLGQAIAPAKAKGDALHPAQKALRKIRARANEPGTRASHGEQFANGLRCAGNILEEALNKAPQPAVRGDAQ